MLTEVDHRILVRSEDIRCLDDVWNHVKYAWKHGHVTRANFPFTEITSTMTARTFRLDQAMHSLAIDQALAERKMRALTPVWFANLLLLREDLPKHTFLVGLGCICLNRWEQPQILFTEPYVHLSIQSKFGVNLRRFDYIWPVGTLVPAMPITPEVT